MGLHHERMNMNTNRMNGFRAPSLNSFRGANEARSEAVHTVLRTSTGVGNEEISQDVNLVGEFTSTMKLTGGEA